MYDDVVLNEYGFYTLKNIPTKQECEAFYRDKYYQESMSTYETVYTKEELKFFEAKLEQKLLLINEYSPSHKNRSFVDIGSGEGFALTFFKKKGFSVLGLDYSVFGLKNHNHDVLNDVMVGDIYNSVDNLVSDKKTFDVVNMDCVLEHVLDPLALLKNIYKLVATDGILFITVPNDFSMLQKYFFDNQIITKPYWIESPDHISYFNNDGLKNICDVAGFDCVDMLSAYMNEFFLLNSRTNYIEDKSVGRSCHFARVEQENIFQNISPVKTMFLPSLLSFSFKPYL